MGSVVEAGCWNDVGTLEIQCHNKEEFERYIIAENIITPISSPRRNGAKRDYLDEAVTNSATHCSATEPRKGIADGVPSVSCEDIMKKYHLPGTRSTDSIFRINGAKKKSTIGQKRGNTNGYNFYYRQYDAE